MDDFHVYPVGDLIWHELEGDECPCGPDTKFVDGGSVVVHNSLDGREQNEISRTG